MSTTPETVPPRPERRFEFEPGDVRVNVTRTAPTSAGAVGVPLSLTSEVPPDVGLSRQRLKAAGFTGEPCTTLRIPRGEGPVSIAIGFGAAKDIDMDRIRDAAAAFALEAAPHERIAFSLEGIDSIPIETAAQAAVEGMLLARYEYAGFGRTPKGKALKEITLVTSDVHESAARSGVERGLALATATRLARDLANTPHSHLTATQMAELAEKLGERHGFDVEVFDKEALVELGCGGLLGVNAGSTEPPRMIKLMYRPPREPTGSIAYVGKGIMYDSGGISLKPNDNVHARMKNDMSGAAAVLAAMAELRDLDCPAAVTGYLMCTDNMPSGTALALGDVITTHGGKTVEVTNTDAEGRLAICDALALAAEEGHDAIVDIATLTGSVMRALGTDMAGIFGSDAGLIEQVKRAAEASGEPVWQLPLHRPYKSVLESDVAQLRNTGPTGGAQPDGVVAALYLAEFVGDVPWAHVDICGTAWHEQSRLWRRAGCSGFGARLLIELALGFRPRKRRTRH